MMTEKTVQKITASHLKRDAYLYVRQSTLRQVVENTERTKRQYALIVIWGNREPRRLTGRGLSSWYPR